MFSEVDPNTALDGVLHLWNERVRSFARASVCSMLALVASFTCSTRKAEATGFPVWIISLDLSKAFDRARWPALLNALFEQRVPQHFIWISQRVCYGQHAEIVSDFGQSNQFIITGSVRQGCVLTPRLFCAVLEFGMRKWKHAVGQAGIDLLDGGPNLLDLRFADDILIFARSRQELGQLIDSLLIHLEQVGLLLNAQKNRGANQWGATASNSCGGWRAETYNLAAPCRSKVVGLHVDSRRVTITTHRSGISSLEISAFCGKSTAWLLGWPAFWLSRAGDIKVLVVHETFRTRWSRNLGNWMDAARDANGWSNLMLQFVTFCAHTCKTRSEGHFRVQTVAMFFISPVPWMAWEHVKERGTQNIPNIVPNIVNCS